MRRVVSSGALVVLLAAALAWPMSAAAPTAKPEEVGFSSERLHRVTDLVQRHIAAGDFSGAVTLVLAATTLTRDDEEGRRRVHRFLDEMDVEARGITDRPIPFSDYLVAPFKLPDKLVGVRSALHDGPRAVFAHA